MAIWENISKKASATTAKAVQQARVLSETTRLNALIAAEESDMEASFAKLGRYYLELHADDYESEFSGIVSAISESKRKIQEYQAQVQNVKGMTRCEKCGAEVAKGSVFCSCCGAMVPKLDAPLITESIRKCPDCGADVKEGARFCTICGHSLTTPEEPEKKEAQAERICPICGTTARGNGAFCTACGAKFEEGE